MALGEDGFYRFVALVPHVSARAAFDSYRRELAAGDGRDAAAVFSFPSVAPIALVKAPASKAALKALAALLRRQSYGKGGGKISAGGEVVTARLPDGNTIAGVPLSLQMPSLPDGIDALAAFPRLILALGIFSRAPTPAPVCPIFKFSAAAVANMTLRPLPYEYSYSWTIGEAQWLPSLRRQFSV
ncbi:MAG: hypothetical protein LBJ86_03605 [Spirochaetaceae bacterium]|jgi:hypothetical protein|nr:hypothetical protein [Spirochaetaceae bacterium]